MDYKETFKRIFLKISDQNLNYNNNIDLYNSILEKIKENFPIWESLIQSNFLINKNETVRTIEHVFRLLRILTEILEDRLNRDLSETIGQKIKEDIAEINNFNPKTLYLLILFHDIGRPVNKEWHTKKSAEMVLKKNLLKKFKIPLIHRRILIGIIKNHLLLGTIFTGESSYTGAISLVHDPYLKPIWENKNKFITLFFKILKVFTIIDILGYSYSRIYDHYYEYYTSIIKHLEELFIQIKEVKNSQKLNFAYKNLKKLDENYLEWRIGGSIRMFQFVKTREYLSEEFFYEKVKGGLKGHNSDLLNIKTQILKKHHLIQFKYALGLMMLLAKDDFSREPPSREFKIKKKIFTFWQICCEKSINYYQNENLGFKIPTLNYFVFHFPGNWYFSEEYKKYIGSTKFFKDLRKIKPVYNKEISAYIFSFVPKLEINLEK